MTLISPFQPTEEETVDRKPFSLSSPTCLFLLPMGREGTQRTRRRVTPAHTAPKEQGGKAASHS